MKSAQRQFLVKVTGIRGYFASKTGGNLSSDSSKVYDGGDDQPDVMAGPAEVDNITVSRAYDYERDSEILQSLRERVGRWQTTVSVTPLRRDMTALRRPTIYPDAMLVGLTEPEVDASSGDAATYELEFAIGRWR